MAADHFDREDVEAVADCLGDDAAQLRNENPEDERADNMDRAASMLTWMLLTHPAYAAGVGEGLQAKARREFAELSEPARRALMGASTAIMNGVHARAYIEHNADRWLCFQFNTWDEMDKALRAVKAWDSAGYRAKDDAAGVTAAPAPQREQRDVPPGKWKVDMPDGTYMQMPGDPPGPASVRAVIGGYVYDVMPHGGKLVASSPPRGVTPCEPPRMCLWPQCRCKQAGECGRPTPEEIAAGVLGTSNEQPKGGA